MKVVTLRSHAYQAVAVLVSTPLPSNEGRDVLPHPLCTLGYLATFQHLYLLMKVVTGRADFCHSGLRRFQHLYLLMKVVTPPFKTLA